MATRTVRPSSGLYYIDTNVPNALVTYSPGTAVGGGRQLADDLDSSYAEVFCRNEYAVDSLGNVTNKLIGPAEALHMDMHDPTVADLLDPDFYTIIGVRLKLRASCTAGGDYAPHPDVQIWDSDGYPMLGSWEPPQLQPDGTIVDIEDTSQLSFWGYNATEITSAIAAGGCVARVVGTPHGKWWADGVQQWDGKVYPVGHEAYGWEVTLNYYELWLFIDYLGGPPVPSASITGELTGSRRRFT